MHLSDFFIGKPGPGSISEALHQGLPVIVVRNAWTMPQERYNTEWIQENNAGIVLDSFSFIREGVSEATRRLGEFQASIGRIRNRAVFEIPDILDRILRIETPQRAHRMDRRTPPMNFKALRQESRNIIPSVINSK